MADIEMKTPESIKTIIVIETKCTRGAGTSANPVRLVTQYWSFDGELLAENDSFMQEKLSLYSNYYKESNVWEEVCEKWITDKLLDRTYFRCPNCHSNANYFVGGTEDWWDIEKPNFCPSCGVKLK